MMDEQIAAPAATEIPVKLYRSATLNELDALRHPAPSTVCGQCTHAVWIATHETLKCYCRALFQHSWTNEESVAITHCDAQSTEAIA